MTFLGHFRVKLVQLPRYIKYFLQTTCFIIEKTYMARLNMSLDEILTYGVFLKHVLCFMSTPEFWRSCLFLIFARCRAQIGSIFE